MVGLEKNIGKTIDTNGWNLKNHWKTIGTKGSHVKNHWETIDTNRSHEEKKPLKSHWHKWFTCKKKTLKNHRPQWYHSILVKILPSLRSIITMAKSGQHLIWTILLIGGFYWTKVKKSELDFGWSFQGYPSWPFMARLLIVFLKHLIKFKKLDAFGPLCLWQCLLLGWW